MVASADDAMARSDADGGCGTYGMGTDLGMELSSLYCLTLALSRMTHPLADENHLANASAHAIRRRTASPSRMSMGTGSCGGEDCMPYSVAVDVDVDVAVAVDVAAKFAPEGVASIMSASRSRMNPTNERSNIGSSKRVPRNVTGSDS